jgi:hypothetical protein
MDSVNFVTTFRIPRDAIIDSVVARSGRGILFRTISAEGGWACESGARLKRRAIREKVTTPKNADKIGGDVSTARLLAEQMWC